MSKQHVCPECGSNEWDYPNIGLPGSILCTDCGHIYPEILSMFPTLKKTETVSVTESRWPFPTSVPKKSLNDDLVKIDGLKDAQESPF